MMVSWITVIHQRNVLLIYQVLIYNALDLLVIVIEVLQFLREFRIVK